LARHRTDYLPDVRRVLDYIAAGDVFQINLSHALRVPTERSATAIYAALRRDTPAAFGALFDLGESAVICNSPELFLRVTPDRRVVTEPIKGTRPPGEGQAEALRESEKDAAELAMIVDLERNDLGRVCELGSVRVLGGRRIERHPTVLHGVATVEGKLRPDVDLVALLAATFPGGSITGAPKIRATQIIADLERRPRGPYCGAIGHLDPDGSTQLNIAIRTMTLTNGIATVPVGGGIVADSDPAAEWEETLVKARALLQALGTQPAAADAHTR
jgi:anthranilate/para-aminobenzoate synthase component I